MILQTLGRMRSKHTTPTSQLTLTRGDTNISGTSETSAESDYTPERSSHLSSNTASTTYPASSITSSPRSTKRYSNNLFSSGRLRDYGYLRTISQKTHRSAVSITQTESSQSLREETSLNSIESLRPITPDAEGHASPPSSPNDKTPVARTASLVSSNEDLPPQSSIDNSSGLRISKRASAALAEVIKEFEEEVEDEIVMPRTGHLVRPTDSDQLRVVDDTKEPLELGASVRHNSLYLCVYSLRVYVSSPTIDHPPTLRQVPQYHPMGKLLQRSLILGSYHPLHTVVLVQAPLAYRDTYQGCPDL